MENILYDRYTPYLGHYIPQKQNSFYSEKGTCPFRYWCCIREGNEGYQNIFCISGSRYLLCDVQAILLCGTCHNRLAGEVYNNLVAGYTLDNKKAFIDSVVVVFMLVFQWVLLGILIWKRSRA